MRVEYACFSVHFHYYIINACLYQLMSKEHAPRVCTLIFFSFSILLKGLCNENKSQEAFELLRMMADNGDSCAPDAVSYTTVIDGLCKEGQVDNAYNLFCEMLGDGIDPDVMTCNSIIDGLCKAQEIYKAEATLQQMLDRGVIPNRFTYITLLHGYCSLGKWN
jgi:pentatricopeptide repeat protein